MTSLNCHLDAGDEEDTPFPSVGMKVVIERHLMMIGNRNHIKIFIGSFGDKLFCRISYAVKGIFSRVEVQVSFQRSLPSCLRNRFLQSFLMPSVLSQTSIYKIFVRIMSNVSKVDLYNINYNTFLERNLLYFGTKFVTPGTKYTNESLFSKIHFSI